MINRRLFRAAVIAGLSAVATLFGMIHSPFPGGALSFPWQTTSSIPSTIASAYGLVAPLLFLLACFSPAGGNELDEGPADI